MLVLSSLIVMAGFLSGQAAAAPEAGLVRRH